MLESIRGNNGGGYLESKQIWSLKQSWSYIKTIIIVAVRCKYFYESGSLDKILQRMLLFVFYILVLYVYTWHCDKHLS